jgi:hypothetical protein
MLTGVNWPALHPLRTSADIHMTFVLKFGYNEESRLVNAELPK